MNDYSNTKLQCRICENSNGNKNHTVMEMMYGTKDKFDYVECVKCGCLQIATIPEDTSKYYKSDYYSYKFILDIPNKAKLLLRSLIIRGRLSNNSFVSKIFSFYTIYPFIDFLYKNKYLERKANILDVGCGSGSLLLQLKYLGFNLLKGVDPFIDKDIKYSNGISVDKKYLNEVSEKYSLIILNHSFEHMDNPKAVLLDISRVLTPDGCAVIRIPIAASFAWKYYGINWVQLDAPRHLYLHTVESMKILSMETDLEVVDVNFDSSEFQFCGSEQYALGIPLTDKKSYWFGKSDIFTRQQIKEYKKRAFQLNESGEGDQACFVFKKRKALN
jgi:SAM-dependent methyltransferase